MVEQQTVDVSGASHSEALFVLTLQGNEDVLLLFFFTTTLYIPFTLLEY